MFTLFPNVTFKGGRILVEIWDLDEQNVLETAFIMETRYLGTSWWLVNVRFPHRCALMRRISSGAATETRPHSHWQTQIMFHSSTGPAGWLRETCRLTQSRVYLLQGCKQPRIHSAAADTATGYKNTRRWNLDQWYMNWHFGNITK